MLKTFHGVARFCPGIYLFHCDHGKLSLELTFTYHLDNIFILPLHDMELKIMPRFLYFPRLPQIKFSSIFCPFLA